METQETLDTIEKSLDSVEETLDRIAPEVVETVNTVKNNPLLLVGVGLVGVSLGFVIGYKVAYRKLELKFDQLLDEEVAKTKDFYAAFHKKDEFSTPESAAQALVPEEKRTIVHSTTAAEAIKKYTGQDVNVVGANNPLSAPSVEEELDVVVEEVKVTTNVFLNGQEVPEDFDPEVEAAERNRDRPYVISKNEFFENVTDAEVSSLTWYEKDQVLVADDDELSPIQDTDAIVGDENLLKFGFGSEDRSTVYIRNDVKAGIYEIVKSPGSYAREVLDLDDEEIEISNRSSYVGGGRKFRHGDD